MGFADDIGASAVDSEKKIFQKRNNIIEREIYATKREARIKEEDKLTIEKTNLRLDYEKREKEREIAQRKQEFVLDLKKNFDDQIKIYNETLDKDRLRPVGQVRYRRESARYKRWKEQQKNGQSNEPKLIHIDTRQITKEMVTDFKKATRQLSGGWRNNNPPMDFYQNLSQRESSYFGNENRPPVSTLLATASYPELSYQRLHEETMKLSKAIFDVDKVTVNNDDDVEVDIFDVEDHDNEGHSDATDTAISEQPPKIEIKEEDKNEPTPVASRVQSAVSSVVSLTESQASELAISRKTSAKSTRSTISDKTAVDPIIRCHTTQTSYRTSSSLSSRRPPMVKRPKTTSVRWRTKSAFNCERMPEKPLILKQYENYNAVNNVVGRKSSKSAIPITEYEKDRIRRVELERTARLKKDQLERQNRMKKYMPTAQRPKSSIFSDRYGSSISIKV
ncbi:Oidioi.mRNA.OKI2018_I69.chr1.g156.t1.cds [Oikopleura dioica]|uniref:Oidioi.mRNA.OKI2018_I69.chr1.g156.t1.cds n=1 Tax=Oikopleura dioica TaxID=34765 RepID=A0ABN7SR72_OIKDI|nr:Oidioi.mRNA.OKI2018_I69.chr1.g156.t1.cds [Oikopleura dioica]